MAIIALSGKMNSGKNLIADIIQWLTNPRIHTNPNIKIGEDSIASYVSFEDWQKDEDNRTLWTNVWKQKAFADKLKEITCLLIGCTREQLEDRQFKEKELGEEWEIYKIVDNNSKRLKFTSFNDYAEAEKWCEENSNSQHRYSVEIINLTPRKLLQLLGTEYGRNIIHPNIWINSLFADYQTPDEKLKSGKGVKGVKNVLTDKRFQYPNWIITDCRFPNEAQSIKDRDGIIIRVNREDDFNSKDWFKSKQGKESKYIGNQKEALEYLKKEKEKMNHPSETALDDYNGFNYIVENNSTIEDLIVKVKEILIKEKILNG